MDTSSDDEKLLQVIAPAIITVPADWKQPDFQQKQAQYAIELWRDMKCNLLGYLRNLQPASHVVSRTIILALDSVRAATIKGFERGSMIILPSVVRLDKRDFSDWRDTPEETLWTDLSVTKRLRAIYLWLLFLDSVMRTPMSLSLSAAYIIARANLIGLAHFTIEHMKKFNDQDPDSVHAANYALPYGKEDGYLRTWMMSKE